MYKYAFTFFVCIFNEIKYLFGCDVILVKQNLLFLVKPMEGEVYNSHTFPLILDLLARAVYDLGDFVSNDKLHILQTVVAVYHSWSYLLRLQTHRQWKGRPWSLLLLSYPPETSSVATAAVAFEITELRTMPSGSIAVGAFTVDCCSSSFLSSTQKQVVMNYHWLSSIMRILKIFI